MTLEQHFQQSSWLYAFHLRLSLCFLERGDLLGCGCFYFFIFFIKSQILVGFVSEFIFKRKVLQEDLLASSMIHRVFALCCFRFSDEGFILNFLRVCLMLSYVLALFCKPCFFFVFWKYCGFRDSFIFYANGDSFICYANEGVGKMYYGFLICIWFWD